MIFRGFLSLRQSSSTECAPITFLPGLVESMFRHDFNKHSNPWWSECNDLTLGFIRQKAINFLYSSVVSDYCEAMISNVQNKVLSLYKQPDCQWTNLMFDDL